MNLFPHRNDLLPPSDPMKTTVTHLFAIFLCILFCSLIRPGDCVGEETATSPKPERPTSPLPLIIQPASPDSRTHLHNLFQLTERIYSGAQPEDEAAFAEIAKMGIRTIVSVDGARPDVEAAQRAGLRYVHIPIGYDGLGSNASESIVNLVKTAEGPFYIHCHHGKHRGPTAAAIACIADGSADRESAMDILEKAGTSHRYPGLWRDVKSFEIPAHDKPLPPLVPIAPINSMASLMVAIDQANEHLSQFAEQDWTRLESHPDLRPAAEAALLRECFRESVRLRSKSKPEGAEHHDAEPYDDAYWRQMLAAENVAADLENAIRSNDHAAANRHLHRMGTLCTKCHDQYRN
ncbi:beta-lactamase hydrolase domain-containing protein [Novipirellula caenicola]|uniref:Cytochrome C n=1 Tax=Novipirellula caenicola TaxID=1536901 RepID=A0ABP9VLF5_9BACT